MSYDFAQRRLRLCEMMMQSITKQHLVIVLPSNQCRPRANTLYEEDSNFWYLSGLSFPRSYLVLYVSINNEGAIQITREFLVTKCSLRSTDLTLSEEARRIHVAEMKKHNFPIFGSQEKLPFVISPSQIVVLQSPSPLFDKVRYLRQRKEKVEQEHIKEAIRRSVAIHEKLSRFLSKYWLTTGKSQISDFEIDGFIKGEIAKFGNACAYPPIVLSGKRAKELHGAPQGWPLKLIDPDRDVLLLDFAVKHEMYCADVTRMFPSRSSSYIPQRYKMPWDNLERLLTHLEKQIDMKNSTMGQLNDLAQIWVTKHITDSKEQQKYLRHAVGHHLGLEVHDPGSSPFMEGDCFALEVGYYDAENNIAIRIEHNYIIENSLVTNLTKSTVED